ncbi:L-seryl-tRNA(Sec) selenium transferase [Desulfurobacterium thermolithotrophum DSM 11699]|uniref:L-seryl-tRNA(Sec) selenium transferase n=1 Tax=Desulfurobacterium thermolithotrophum (strain DSM 11699 / BSA) TaxID=868864 RepID=F0S382_DESTD|nr:L-seryl-tRNA(Sec) selenium transferase [Desulfurobacterium thermolithotrophum]ADY73304.1 L-seryl-tRNA(Sec) selenium transferase [Desulfurobacterium thermolithotrophum DSM 11699]
MRKELLKRIPKVDVFVEDKELLELLGNNPRTLLVESIRNVLDRLRKDIVNGKVLELDKEKIKGQIKNELRKLVSPKLKRVINATGVVLHTNLGRAPISEKIAEHLKWIITGYSNLEYDLEKGKRGLRYKNLEWILKKLTGAEDVCVVNNNAGAVLLVLSALAKGKEVVVSRGELIEIGGSFRIPDVMVQSGAILKEVGTTNKTHLWDYENAINENTGLILKVHTSNYRVLGFTESVSTKELVELGKKYNIPVYEDLGSGSFIDVRKLGLSYEPTVQDVLKAGADVVSFSGDKLLGGAQAGIIVGKKEFIEKIKKHPLNRALRIDKMTLSVLEATLVYYLDEEKALKEIPTWNLLSQPLENIKRKAEKLYSLLDREKIKAEIKIVKDESEVGGGALPIQKLPTYAVAIKPSKISVKRLESLMREMEVPVVGRIKENVYLLDMRTVFDNEIKQLAFNLKKVLI